MPGSQKPKTRAANSRANLPGEVKSESEGEQSRIADSMEAAAAMAEIPLAIVKWAKARGCSAFRGSRVDVDGLEEWLQDNQPSAEMNAGNDAPLEIQLMLADLGLKLERKEGQKITNAKLRGELHSTKEICDKLHARESELKTTLQTYLIDKLPAINAGLDATKQRENNRKAFVDICNRFRQFAKEYDELLAKESAD